MPEEQPANTAVVLTALREEYLAVKAHLSELREETTDKGTIYQVGVFADKGITWRVGIAEIGPGNTRAAAEAERAIAHFRPSVALFVGVAGGLKDVRLGDVVAATKVYGYQGGKAAAKFLPRPEVGNSSYRIEQRARAEGRGEGWRHRIRLPMDREPLPAAKDPVVHVAPIAAGDQVVADTRSPTFLFLRSACSDAVAVEMEGIGFLKTVEADTLIEAGIIRGISDLLNEKESSDRAGWQTLAAAHAAAFAFQVLSRLWPARTMETTATLPIQSSLLGAVGDRIRICELLGKGGMGQVFRARHLELNHDVAVKFMNTELLDSPKALDRFRREAQNALKLVHPNIVRVHDLRDFGNGRLYIQMELIEGRTLRDLLREGRLSTARALDLGRTILGALSYSHDKGVLHLDVSPENVLITPEGIAKLVDFGLARGLDSKTVYLTLQGAGKAIYMAPEQVEGRIDLDARADVYAAAAVLYEMLSGVPPHGVLEPLGQDVPEAVREAIVLSMAAKREKRPATARDFLSRLGECGRPAKAETVPNLLSDQGAMPVEPRGLGGTGTTESTDSELVGRPTRIEANAQPPALASSSFGNAPAGLPASPSGCDPTAAVMSARSGATVELPPVEGVHKSAVSDPPGTSVPFFELVEVHKTLNDLHVLQGVNLNVCRGETLVLMGRTGCGKTVLLKHMAGLMRPDRGKVSILGRDLAGDKGSLLAPLRKRRVTCDRASLALFPLPRALSGSLSVTVRPTPSSPARPAAYNGRHGPCRRSRHGDPLSLSTPARFLDAHDRSAGP